MFKDIKARYEAAEETKKECVDVLQELCEYLSGTTGTYILDYDYSIFNPFDIGYEEKIKHVSFSDTHVKIILEYKDPYEGYDSASKLVIPLDIVNRWYDSDLDYIKEEVIKLCKKVKKINEHNELESLKVQASLLGYELIKKEK